MANVEEYNTNNKCKTYLRHKLNDHLPSSFYFFQIHEDVLDFEFESLGFLLATL
jgi:hypothetical protein